jgi:polyferredoxin
MLTQTASPSDVTAQEGARAKRKKAFVRRLPGDRSQQIRRTVQLIFLMLNAWIGIQFVLWVRYFENRGNFRYFERPAGVDGWLPIAGLMNLRYFFVTHHFPAIHPSAMVLLCVFLLSSLLIKKSFCSWLCPIGTVSEYLWKLGRKLTGRIFNLPLWLDLPLRGLKYLLLAFFLFVVFKMTAQDLGDFLASPFGIVADVKMLDFFRTIGIFGIVVMATLIALSVFIQNFWCRFLCPYGALMGIVSIFSPAKIRRDAEACIDCGKCNKACPSHLAVDMLVQIRSVECTGCMECIAVCPAENALQLSLPPRRVRDVDGRPHEGSAARWRLRILKPQIVALVLALVFFGLIGAARATGHWQTNVSRDIYMQLVPDADSVGH